MTSEVPFTQQGKRIAYAIACAVVLTIGLMLTLSSLPRVMATSQDDDRGFWTDTFTDATGISTLVSTTLDTVNGQVVLDVLPVHSQTDWSGGGGLISTTATTDRYQIGEGVDVTVDGILRLGYTLRANDQMADLNGDGYLDLVISSFFSGTNYPVGTFNTDSYVYYGSAQGYTTTNRLELPTFGANGNLVADLNEDGYLDIVFCEYLGHSHIYWGSADGYTTTNRTALSVINDVGCSASDLDADGYLDLVFAVYQASGSYVAESFIYWGSTGGYTDTNRSGLATMGALASYIADLDVDGYLDIVFTNYRTDGGEYVSTTYEIDSYIYWGSDTGYTTMNRAILPTVGAHGSTATDLNRDGYLDIIFSNRHTADGIAYTYDVNSYIYWGGAGGYTTTRRTELPTLGAYGNSVADLNGDDHWDIVFSNHQSSSVTHTVSSYIYWGNASSVYTTAARTDLPTIGATGATVGDLDQDGYLDLVFSNRRSAGNHNIDSYIYWGSSTGYAVTNRALLPTHGALGNSTVGSPIICANTSFGNMYARAITGSVSLTDSMQTPSIYPPTGVLTSSVFDGGSVHRWDRAIWNAAIPPGTGITIEVSSSSDGSSWSSWEIVGSGSVSGTNQATLSLTPSRFLRYRVALQSSNGHFSTPTLFDLAFRGDYAPTGSVTSVAVTPLALSAWDAVSWTAVVSPEHALSIQVLSGAGSVLPDGVLPGNSAGFSSSPIDISAVDASTYPNLRLRAALSTSVVTTTPTLDEWHFSWFGSPASIAIVPAVTTVTAGDSVAYTVTAYDGYGKNWDVTQETSFDIASSAEGIWSSNTYTSERSGTWVVTATYQSQVATATLIVDVGALDHIEICTDANGESPAGAHVMTTDDSWTLYAAGYDSENNFISNQSVTWDQTGTLDDVSGSGTSYTFNPFTAGTSGTITANDGTHTDGTGTITVNPGALDHIEICTDANGESPAGAHVMTTDDSWTLYAAGYDSENNFISNQSVTWDQTGTLDDVSGSGTSYTFSPSTAGTSGTITADDGTRTDGTGTITVNLGALDHVTLTPDPAVRTAGTDVTYALTAYDGDGNGWDVTSSGEYTITLGAGGSWVDNIFTTEVAGSWTVTGTYSGEQDTASLTVNTGPLDHIEICTDANGESPAGAHVMTTDDSWTLYAAGYDEYDNFISNQSVTWDETGTLDDVSGSGTSYTFNPVTAGTSGTITADDGTHADGTGTITVNVGALNYVEIEDAAGGTGSTVDSRTMTAGDTLDVWAAGYDADDNYIADQVVTWSGTGVVAGQLSPTSGVSTTFTAQDSGTGTIQADHPTAIDDETGSITVNPAGLDYFAIEDAAGGTGTTMDTHSMNAGETLDVWAAGYDEYDNYLGDVSVTWSGTGVVVGQLSPTSGISTTLAATTAGTGTIQADAGGGITDTTGTITVNPGSLHRFVFDTIVGQTVGEPFGVRITAQDEYSNTVTNYGDTASLTDTTGTIAPTAVGFVDGEWTGQATIAEAQYGVWITAQDGGVSGNSNSFDVLFRTYLPLVMR